MRIWRDGGGEGVNSTLLLLVSKFTSYTIIYVCMYVYKTLWCYRSKNRKERSNQVHAIYSFRYYTYTLFVEYCWISVLDWRRTQEQEQSWTEISNTPNRVQKKHYFFFSPCHCRAGHFFLNFCFFSIQILITVDGFNVWVFLPRCIYLILIKNMNILVRKKEPKGLKKTCRFDLK